MQDKQSNLKINIKIIIEATKFYQQLDTKQKFDSNQISLLKNIHQKKSEKQSYVSKN